MSINLLALYANIGLVYSTDNSIGETLFQADI